MRVAGVMSGTSLDGIDVAIVEISGRRVETIGFLCTPYSEPVRSAILGVSDPASISHLNFQLGELYARAVLRAVRRYGPVELIGCHGQTIYHEGGVHTLQIGEAAVVAERTGVPVVSNFRARDIAAGGEGAPLVPYVDYLLFRHPKRARIALNIGGIANITVIPSGAAPEDVVAFDTGPGNMVIDALAREMGLPCDRGGKIAASGRVDRALLDDLLADPYYRRPPPKSAGREQYGAEFIARLKNSGLPMPDLIATATVLTAATVAQALVPAVSALVPTRCAPAKRREDSRRGTQECVRHSATDLIVSGGGVHNPQIMAHLAGFLPGIAISTSTDHGVDADAKEAIAFAVLAYQTWRKRPSNLPSATGARHAVVLGDISWR
ncbi:MAG: anhydro-N-acetylmuramic acid kinase [Bryobacteraceae bacterium]